MKQFILSIFILLSTNLYANSITDYYNEWSHYSFLGYGEIENSCSNDDFMAEAMKCPVSYLVLGGGGRNYNIDNSFFKWSLKYRSGSNIDLLSVGYGWGKTSNNKTIYFEIIPHIDYNFEEIGYSLDFSIGLTKYKMKKKWTYPFGVNLTYGNNLSENSDLLEHIDSFNGS